MSTRLRVAVLISGGGTTLKNLLDYAARGQINVDFQLVISSNANARGLTFAAEAQIPTHIVRRAEYATPEEHSQAVFQPCRDAEVDFVLMGGFLSHVLIPEDFENRVINTHPALIPSFCGKGFYGLKVHQAVIDYGAKISGCTLHFVDNQYDHGPIILQKSVDVLPDDTAEALAKRVFARECQAYPEVLQLLSEDRISVNGRRVLIDKK